MQAKVKLLKGSTAINIQAAPAGKSWLWASTWDANGAHLKGSLLLKLPPAVAFGEMVLKV